MPPDRLCNLIYYWLARNLDDKRRREFDERLHRPPSGATTTPAASGVWSADDEMAAFRKAQQATAGI